MSKRNSENLEEKRRGPKPKKPKHGIGRRIWELRKAKKIATLAEFEVFCGLSSGALSKFHRGGRPTPMVIQRIAAATGCNPDWLSDGEGEPFPAKIPPAINEVHESGQPYGDLDRTTAMSQKDVPEIEILFRPTRKPRDGDICVCKINFRNDRFVARILAYLVDE